MNRSKLLIVSTLFATLSFPIAALAQASGACPASPPLPIASQQNLFTEDLEVALGDVIADRTERNFNVVEGELNQHLQQIADRLVREMPPTKIPIRVRLIDIPEVNAFAYPGGRIYVTRKLVVASKSDDEIAGVIAHEIGHIIARQSSLRMSQLLQRVLNITSLKDRADVAAKYHQLLENAARKPKAFETKESHEEKDQIVADTVAVYAVARAGYRPQAYTEFWDRFTENQGKTGNAFSDFFGATKPESKRLREMLRYAQSLPPACMPGKGEPMEAYRTFRLKVVENEGMERKEDLPGLISRRIILTPLREEIRHLRFSPDKKYIIAQDDANIYVLTFEPFSYLFQLKAKNANAARFSADSRRILFHDDALRVEEWDIATRKRTQVSEVARKLDCLQSELSPDGKYLGCWNPENVLQVLDVSTGEPIFSQKDFWQIETMSDYSAVMFSRFLGPLLLRRLMSMEFTPDGKLFAAAHGRANVVLDIATRAKVPVSGRVKEYMERSFAFTGTNQMIGVSMYGKKGEVLSFPDGKTINKFDVGSQEVYAPAHGSYVIIRPIRDFPVGVLDSATGKIFLANNKSALDVYDDYYVSERKDGEIGLYDRKLPQPQVVKTAPLPTGDLSSLRAFAISPEMKYLAVSETTRGSVWNLETGDRVLRLRGFRGAIFTGPDEVVLSFPPLPQKPKADDKAGDKGDKDKKEEAKPTRQYVVLDLKTGQTKSVRDVDDDDEDDAVVSTTFMGDIVLATKGGGRKRKDRERDVTLEIRNPATDAVLWSRHFPKEAPDVYYTPWEGRMMLTWRLGSSFAKDQLAKDPALAERSPAKDRSDDDFLIHVVDNKTGNVYKKVILKTGAGSFRIRDLDSAGDYLLVRDNQRRSLVFSMESGEIVARYFGNAGFISSEAQVVAMESSDGQLSLYRFSDLNNRAAKLDFPSGISGIRFGKGGRLFVFTDNQTAYQVDLPAAMKAGEAKQAAAK